MSSPKQSSTDGSPHTTPRGQAQGIRSPVFGTPRKYFILRLFYLFHFVLLLC